MIDAYARIFPPLREHARFRPLGPSRGDPQDLALRWLGTAGHVIEQGGTTILLDPFVTRPGPGRLLRRLEPDLDAIARHVPAHVDAIVCGHSHYDHLLDAPAIALARGARLVGSRTTCAFAEAAGVPRDRLTVVPAEGGRVEIGALTVELVPSRHGRIALGRVPLPGEVVAPPRLPAPLWHYRMGGAFGVLVRPTSGTGPSVYHNGSADLVDVALAGHRADVVLVGLAGRRATRDYLGRLLGALEPAVVVPTHHDAFFAPLDRGVHLLPRIDLEGFFAEAAQRLPRATRLSPTYDDWIVVPRADPRGAHLAGV